MYCKVCGSNKINERDLILIEDYFDEEDHEGENLILSQNYDVLICEPTLQYKETIGVEKWCNDNCNFVPKNCPKSICICQVSIHERLYEREEFVVICEPKEIFKNVAGMSSWCKDNCNGPTRFCPKTFCSCKYHTQ